MTSHTVVTLRLIASSVDHARIGALETAWSSLETSPTADIERLRSSESAVDRNVAGKDSFATLHGELRSLAGDATKREGRAMMIPRLEARFRLTPGAATEAAAAIVAGKEDIDTSRALLGALSGAGTPEAQAALATVIGAEHLEADVRMGALGAIGMTKSPTGAAVESIRSQVDSEVPALRSTAQLALGNAAHRLREEGKPPGELVATLAEQLEAGETADDKTVALMALGNAGDKDTLDAIAEQLASPSPEVRQAALRALRFIDDPKAAPAPWGRAAPPARHSRERPE